MYTFTPPRAPVIDRDQALDALWAFVQGIGLSPAKVVAAYASQDALKLGLAVGQTCQVLEGCMPKHLAQQFKGEP